MNRPSGKRRAYLLVRHVWVLRRVLLPGSIPQDLTDVSPRSGGRNSSRPAARPAGAHDLATALESAAVAPSVDDRIA